MRTVSRPEEEPLNEAYVSRLAEEFKKSKEALDAMTKRQDAMKKELTEYVNKYGTPDHNGHLWLKVDGLELKRERRVSRVFDTGAAEEWARNENLWDDLKMVLEVLDEDKLLALAWDNEDIAEIVQGFYSEKETWAFKA